MTDLTKHNYNWDKEWKLELKDVQMIFSNFRGLTSQYNPSGARSFGVIIDPVTAKKLRLEGWSVKNTRTDDGAIIEFLIVWIKGEFLKFLSLNEKDLTLNDDLSVLDLGKNITATVHIRGFAWEINNRSGVKNYLTAFEGRAN